MRETASEDSSVRFFPWYINTRQVGAYAGQHIDPRAQVSILQNSIERVMAMEQARRIGIALVARGIFPNLQERILTSGPPDQSRPIFGAIWGNAIFRGSPFKPGKASKSIMRVRAFVEDREVWFQGALSPEHYVSSSGVHYMSGRRQTYVVGQFGIDAGAETGTVHPWMVGELMVGPGDCFYPGWDTVADVDASTIDAFKKMRDVRPPAIKKLLEVMSAIPETAIKSAFAKLLGEPFVPKDWAGEQSDLFTSRLSIDGTRLKTAFAFKGPGTQGPLTLAKSGKNGDQIMRLFKEPADLFVVQHWQKVDPTIRHLMRALAVDVGRPTRYCVIDGADTYCILKAYGFLDRDGVFGLSTVD